MIFLLTLARLVVRPNNGGGRKGKKKKKEKEIERAKEYYSLHTTYDTISTILCAYI